MRVYHTVHTVQPGDRLTAAFNNGFNAYAYVPVTVVTTSSEQVRIQLADGSRRWVDPNVTSLFTEV